MSDEKISKMVNKKQENKINYNFSKLKSQYNLQKGIINKLESQILNSDQVQELIRRQDFEIQQKDEIISQCKSELIQLHNTMFQYKEYSQVKSEMLSQQQEELILFQALREQYLHVQTNSQYTQTIPIDKQNTIIVQRYTEDQKTEGLLRLIRDGQQLYKKLQNFNKYLPNIQALTQYKKQLETKIESCKLADNSTSQITHELIDNKCQYANSINQQTNVHKQQINNIEKQKQSNTKGEYNNNIEQNRPINTLQDLENHQENIQNENNIYYSNYIVTIYTNKKTQ
ncbi:Hypothetical_protein [Hexamita inflata]|uniref:Hypothetical_protein n=1 Tax=Hexamita inflata TaxID=28002 RepID=A0AA86R193_9EUKA|nr:Hypothetical protein HINF_LOCUS52721 [Hexamita inflata]